MSAVEDASDICSFPLDILGSEHEEAIFAATEAFKGLINACVDIGLIKQGVDEITNASLDARKSGPTIIEKVCATIESLLDYQYSAAWDMAFQVVSTMFDKLGIAFAFYPFILFLLLKCRP